jgi:hypothetical protein
LGLIIFDGTRITASPNMGYDYAGERINCPDGCLDSSDPDIQNSNNGY